MEAAPIQVSEHQLKLFTDLMETDRLAVARARVGSLSTRLYLGGRSLLGAAADRAEKRVANFRQVRTLAEMEEKVLAEAKRLTEHSLAAGVPVYQDEIESLKDHIFDRHLVLSDRTLRGLVEGEPALLQITAETIAAIPNAIPIAGPLEEFAAANPGATWADLRMQSRRIFQQIFPEVRTFPDLVIQVVHARLAPVVEQGIDRLAERAGQIQAAQAVALEDDLFVQQARGWLGRRLAKHSPDSPLPKRSLGERVKQTVTGQKPTLEELEEGLKVDTAAPVQLQISEVETPADVAVDERSIAAFDFGD